MNAVVEPGIAIAKVIAGGSAGEGWLRATIQLTPAVSAEDLPHWPSQMIQWLRYKKFRIQLQAQVVTYTGADGRCPALPANARPPIAAEVTAMESTWGKGGDATWVDAFWAHAFDAKTADVWSRLASVIEQASQGDTLAASGGMMAAEGTDPNITVDKARQKTVPATDEKAVLEWILPSRQTELSLLLEYKRALELCDSASLAHAPSAELVSRELACSQLSQRRPEDPKDGPIPPRLTDLFSAAREQFQQTHGNVKRLYSETPCGPLDIQASAMSDPSWLGTADRIVLEGKVHDPLDSYQAANQPQQYQVPKGKENHYTPEDVLGQIFYALQSSPTLSRLLALTLDVRFRAETLEAALNTQPQLAGGGHFVYLAVNDDSVCRNALSCRIYTLAKYRQASSPPHFWPASRAEVVLGQTPERGRLFEIAQYDGVMVAGRRVKIPGGEVGRFELSTLDVHSAAEAALDRRSLQLQRDEEINAWEHQWASSSPAQRPAASARKTHVTAGLVILDRGRQQQAVAQFAARVAHQEHRARPPASVDALLLDADDLTVGYRMDVGVPLKGKTPAYAWRALMARTMKHGTSGGRFDRRVEAIARGLFLDPSSGPAADVELSWRRCLEDGSLALPARLIPRSESTDEGAPVDAFVEEAIGAWTGEPMSVPCTGKREQKVTIYGLPSGCVVMPPTSERDAERRSPALRFGVPYRVGLRAVYSGGISVPLRVAIGLYESERSTDFPLGGSLTIPPVPPLPNTDAAEGPTNPPPVRRRDLLRRFLRHERIDAPFLLLPERLALHAQRPMEHERTAHAVVRTVYGGLRDRQSPIVTQRVFVIPGVSQAFVAMHGVFDRTREAHPSEGLQSRRFGTHGVRFDAQDGGFPVVMSNAIVGFNGVPYLASRRLSKPDERATGGELVYAMATTSIRTQPYYPDPAANAYVIGVRVAGTGIYLEGGPCVISAYGSGYRYPDARPLVLTIQRVSKPRRRAAELTLDEVLSWPKKDSNGRLPSLPNGATRLPGAVEALLSLAPGEDFEVDVWCVPESGDLAKRFAVIESVGALAIARARKDTAQSPPTRQQVCVALAQMLPKIACVEADKCLPDPGNDADPLRDWEEGCGGPGGLPAPGPETLGAIARALHVALLGRPLDELTAVRTLRATHATDRPSLAPELVLQTSDEPLPTLTRVADMPNERNAYVANGHIAFHLPTTGCIELSAEMASPSSDTFDDVRRGRSLLDKRFGTWPREEGVPVPVKRIFGFDISATGEVTLPKTKHVALYRLDDIPLPIPPQESAEGDPPAQPAQDGELHTIPLEAVLKLRGRDPTLGSGKSTFQFSDGLARLLCLKVTAYARHGDQMRTASAPAKNGEWLRDGAALSSEQAAAYSGYVSAWLLANVRPAEPSTRTPVPAFVWITEPTDKKPGVTTWEVRRRSIIRIPLLRPWFSSGEDERLGIVVWPPNLFTHHEGQLADDEVNNGRVMTLTDFQDEDLGPGGKFITRWGGDPIRTPAPRISQRRTFIPAKAFVDQSQDIGTGFKAELVSNVKMPIRITEDGAPDAKAPTTVPPTLEVSLLTYQPKFDVEEELWYVDVTLEHEIEAEPFVRLGLVRFQPHAPPHLQVSYPVTQWTQLLPRRCAKITKSTSAVTVHVEGLASAPGPTDLGPEDTNDERRSVPRLTARIVRECDPDKGIPTRSVIEEAHLEPIIKNLPTAEKYHAVWEKEMPFAAQKPDDARERSKYFVVLEEKELRLPATYLNEPVSREMALGRTCENGEAEDVMVESGTRFFVRIELDA